MPREFSRGRRVADLIQHELAVLIQKEIKDPRVGMVTLTEVKVSRDLAWADVYFTTLADQSHDEAEAALANAAGFLRSRLARHLDTRTTPRLRFHYDSSIENGARMSQAIADAIGKDRLRPGHGDGSDGDSGGGTGT